MLSHMEAVYAGPAHVLVGLEVVQVLDYAGYAHGLVVLDESFRLQDRALNM